jgi:hypothetical protein
MKFDDSANTTQEDKLVAIKTVSITVGGTVPAES